MNSDLVIRRLITAPNASFLASAVASSWRDAFVRFVFLGGAVEFERCLNEIIGESGYRVLNRVYYPNLKDYSLTCEVCTIIVFGECDVEVVGGVLACGIGNYSDKSFFESGDEGAGADGELVGLGI